MIIGIILGALAVGGIIYCAATILIKKTVDGVADKLDLNG